MGPWPMRVHEPRAGRASFSRQNFTHAVRRMEDGIRGRLRRTREISELIASQAGSVGLPSSTSCVHAADSISKKDP